MNNIERVQRQRAAMIQYITKIELKVSRLYGNTCAMIADLQEVKDIINQGSDFTWAQNPEASRKLEKILETYANNVSNIISVACSTAQGQGIADACGNAAYLYANTTGRDKAMVDAVTASALKQQRTNAANAHYYDKRSKGGLQISKNVWKYNDMIKQDMEVAIQNTILEGKSAADLSREVRPMLQNPNALFRRVRNPKTGELELSKAAAAYHPGRGVYRSAYMNAMRLTRTEINAAYRQAETEAYATNPLVSGYRIQPSANHTTLYKGKRIPLYDICDELQGVYPSTFRWSGWHPQCRCIIVPMAIDEDEFETLLYQRGEAIREGKNPNSVDTSFINQVKYPQAFEDWAKINIKRLKKVSTPSTWIGQALELVEKTSEDETIINAIECTNNIFDQLSEKGYSSIHPYVIGKLNKDILDYLAKSGVTVELDDIYMSVKQIIHCQRETKGEKRVSREDLIDFIKNKDKIDVFYDGDGVIYTDYKNKFIVHLNYKMKIDKEHKLISNFITAGKVTSVEEFKNEGRYTKIKSTR